MIVKAIAGSNRCVGMGVATGTGNGDGVEVGMIVGATAGIGGRGV